MERKINNFVDDDILSLLGDDSSSSTNTIARNSISASDGYQDDKNTARNRLKEQNQDSNENLDRSFNIDAILSSARGSGDESDEYSDDAEEESEDEIGSNKDNGDSALYFASRTESNSS